MKRLLRGLCALLLMTLLLPTALAAKATPTPPPVAISTEAPVQPPEQKQFVAQVPGAKLSVYPAKHEIYMSTNDVMEKYVPEVIGFLRG